MDRIKRITCYFREAIKAKECDAIDLKQQDDFWIVEPEEYRQGLLNPLVTRQIFDLKYKKPPGRKGKRPECLDVILIPKTIRKVSDEEGIEIDRGFKDLTGLFFIPARLGEDGNLSFHTNCKKLPWIPRELLHPMVEPQLCIGDSRAYNDYLERTLGQLLLLDSWPAYRTYAETFYEEITRSDFQADTLTIGETEPEKTTPQKTKDISRPASAGKPEDTPSADCPVAAGQPTDRSRTLTVSLNPDIYICLDPTVQASGAILNLYAELADQPIATPLYETFLSGASSLSPLVPNDSVEKMKEHAGQMNGKHPLSPSQREALHHFLEMKDGDILAVSGPPGTGKTTLLQSIVATQVVGHALRQEKAPLIVASSTNNQAITNIIDSFGAIQPAGPHHLEKRWICGVDSFATYFPSIHKIQQASNKGYQCTSCNADYFAEQIDAEENLQQSATEMLANCSLYFRTPFDQIAACKQALHDKLTGVHKARIALLSLFDEIACLTGGRSLADYFHELDRSIRHQEHTLRQAEATIADAEGQALADKERVKEWEALYAALPWYLRTFSFLPSSQKKIYTRFRLEKQPDETVFLDGDLSLDAIRERYSFRIQERYRQIDRAKQDMQACRKAIRRLQEKKQQAEALQTACLHQTDLLRQHHDSLFLHGKKTEAKEENQAGNPSAVWERFIEQTDRAALNDWLDPTARYIEFWLAVHYYECRWIEKEDMPVGSQRGKSFENTLRNFYHRLALVTPCQVMTFFMLPKNFKAYNGNTKKTFHLYNEIDLLIVDEAGQVSPEIAAASFALARKAVVVGDENQLPPVWGVPRAVDIAIAMQYGLIEGKDAFGCLSESGINCSESSVMKVAKQACQYQKEPVRGLFLSEHRRCYDEIIQFCNELLYKQRLVPLRGKGRNDPTYPLRPLPHTGHVDIPTRQSQPAGLSRCNETEAREIARWIRLNYPLLYTAYKNREAKIRPDEILAIVTPFKAQVRTLMAALKKELPLEVVRNIAVGTVHTFQGAERKVVLLSTVYGAREGGYFFEQNPNLINVAVSRAKDCFLVFGSREWMKGPVGRLLKAHTTPAIASGAFRTEDADG